MKGASKIRHAHEGEQRLIEVGDQRLRFRVRQGADRSERKVVTLPGADFLHRFLQHVLPPGFQRRRHYGLTASRCKKAKLTLCHQPLRVTAPEPRPQETVEVFWLRVADVDIHRCPECGGRLQIWPACRRCEDHREPLIVTDPAIPKAAIGRRRPIRDAVDH